MWKCKVTCQVYRNYKVYRGMASVEAQIDWRGHSSSVEGVTTTLPIKGPVDDISGVLGEWHT